LQGIIIPEEAMCGFVSETILSYEQMLWIKARAQAIEVSIWSGMWVIFMPRV
jgi:hypothetical protein